MTQNGYYFAGVEVQAHIVDRVYPAKGFAYVAKLNQTATGIDRWLTQCGGVNAVHSVSPVHLR